jgi:hypothetical protein
VEVDVYAQMRVPPPLLPPPVLLMWMLLLLLKLWMLVLLPSKPFPVQLGEQYIAKTGWL